MKHAFIITILATSALILYLFLDNIELNQKIIDLETTIEEQEAEIIKYDQENYILEIEKEEWKELFYSQICFGPYENCES